MVKTTDTHLAILLLDNLKKEEVIKLNWQNLHELNGQSN